MIAFMEGGLETKQDGSVLINVNGVGYRVEISLQTLNQLAGTGSEIRLLIHHHFTDSDQRLFGFLTHDEQELFQMLITVKGIGPKMGLTIMSGMGRDELADSIWRQDTKALSRIPGIGKKTAERMILELKDKVQQSVPRPAAETGGSTPTGREEAISALEALGFKKRDAEKVVMEIVQEEQTDDIQEIIRKALKRRM